MDDFLLQSLSVTDFLLVHATCPSQGNIVQLSKLRVTGYSFRYGFLVTGYSSMFDIIAFGSAAEDILVKSRHVTLLKYDNNTTEGKEICFPLGSKIDVEDLQFSVGGGGTNTAATFALQRLKTAYCGTIGQDISGAQIIKKLKKLSVNTSLVVTTNKKATNHSVVISGQGKDRTVLAYRGAAELMQKKDIPWKKLKAKWMYLAPLSGLLCDNFEELVIFAHKNNIKVAVNPGMAELSLPKEKLAQILSRVEVVFLNQEEASFLTKIPYQQEQHIFKKLDEMVLGVAVMTKGSEGVSVSDGEYLYSAKAPAQTTIVDTLGAGDSFASGFLTAYITSNGNIEKAIQLGMGNAIGCLSKAGAQNGLLKKGQKFQKIEVKKREI